MPGKVKKSSSTAALTKWRAACRAEGYLGKCSGFKALPKKGTAAYKKIKKVYKCVSK